MHDSRAFPGVREPMHPQATQKRRFRRKNYRCPTRTLGQSEVGTIVAFPYPEDAFSAMPIKTVLYVSKAAGSRSLTHLRTLVPHARAANQRREITGVLLFDGRNYTEVLEGPTKAIDAVMAGIAMDTRHSRMRVLSDQRRPRRSYVGFPLTYLYDQARRDLTTELVDGKRVSGLELRDIFGGTVGELPSVQQR